MKLPSWGRRKRAVVRRAECLKLAELAADTSILLGIKWKTIEFSKPCTVAKLVQDLDEARRKGSVLHLPQNLDFFPDLDFEFPKVRTSCLFLLVVAEELSLIRNVDPAKFPVLDEIFSMARISPAIFKTLSSENVENESLSA